MKALYDVPAPAKLNLFLHVTGRRADGYHLLQSVFMLLDWCDTLHFERRSDSQIRRQDLTVQLPADDLITRAARLLQQHTGCSDGADIAIEKRLPAQAGMGGGSSDAASCLLALNRLWGLHLHCAPWSSWVCSWAQTSLSSCGAATPGSRAWANRSPPSPCRQPGFASSSPPRVWKPHKFFARPA